MMSSFFGCFCKLICLIATCSGQRNVWLSREQTLQDKRQLTDSESHNYGTTAGSAGSAFFLLPAMLKTATRSNFLPLKKLRQLLAASD